MGWVDSFHLQLNLFLLKIHGLMATVLLFFGRETMLTVNGKTLLLLSLLLIFIQLGIVAGMLVLRRAKRAFIKRKCADLHALLLIKISGILSKISLITSVNLLFLLLFALMVLLLILLLKRLISSASFFHLIPPCSIQASLLLLLLLSGVPCLYL